MHFSFTRKNRIFKSYIFKKVYTQGEKFTGKYVVLYLLKNDTEQVSMGLSVSKRRGPAVKRNLIKRWIRESFRQNKNKASVGFMAIFVARSKISEADVSFSLVDQEINRLFVKAGVYEANK